jgi:hypothetical protein
MDVLVENQEDENIFSLSRVEIECPDALTLSAPLPVPISSALISRRRWIGRFLCFLVMGLLLIMLIIIGPQLNLSSDSILFFFHHSPGIDGY